MNFLQKAVLLAIFLFQAPSVQPRPQLQILLLNGVDGKPIAKSRLLIFAGSASDEVRFERHEFDLATNDDGVATVPAGQMWPARLQVLVDFMHVCQEQPDLHTFSLAEAMT